MSSLVSKLPGPGGRVHQRLRDWHVNRAKLGLVDRACRSQDVSSIADLGGCWSVDGAYLLRAVDRHGVGRAVMVDTNPTPGFERAMESRPAVELVRGNFGAPESAETVGEVDAVLLYDVLLHQVRPDWDEILAMYAERARCLVVFNQQWTGDETVRLLDLGPEEYVRNVPKRDFHAGVLEHLDEEHPGHGRLWRDVHHIWQWGITDADLVAKARELGFGLAYHADVGPYQDLESFRNGSFLFVRDG